MAAGGEEAEYESDPEEAMLPLAMRRMEASDDEEGEGEERDQLRRIDLRVGAGSGSESDGQGGAPAYGDEESEMEEEEEEEEDEEEFEEEEEQEFAERGIEGGDEALEVEVPAVILESVGGGGRPDGERTAFNGKIQAEEEKKENEPFAVPTAGAFYMHDDRFRDNVSARHRRTPGGRKLWESKDDCKWGHDKFEAMTLQEARYEEERRAPKGHYRGRSKNRGIDHGYVRGNRSRAYSNSNNQNHASKGVRGRGPRRYEPPTKNNSKTPPTQNKQSGKSLETTSNISSGRVSKYTSTVQSDLVPPRKHAFASSLSSASPPFYPSGSSNQDISVTQKRDVQAGSTNRNLPSSGLMEEKLSTSHSNALLRGKIVADSFGQGKLYIDESNRPLAGKSLTNLHLQSSGSSSINTTQSSQSRAQGRGLSLSGQLTRPIPSVNQVNRVSQTQLPALQQRSVQIPVQPSLRFSSQQLGQHPGGSQASPPKASSTNSSEPGETESPPGSSKSNGALVGKGKASAQGSGRGSFLYSGAQVIGAMGNMGVAHGDQNFPPLLQVMQFGGQRPGGLGVPAVGMALPGYVAQPQGFGNSEMTWLPVLAGAAGALGAPYCSPYFTVDGGYYARPSGQTSSLGVSSKESSTTKPSNVWKSPQRPELVNDEFGQRQNKPRRYSEMNFGE